MKICCACKQKFPATLEFFHRKKPTKDGLQHSCKKCRLSEIGDYQKTIAGKAMRKRVYKRYYATINGYLRHVFQNMKQRCSNPNCHSYRWYGEKGIKVSFISADEFIDYVVNTMKVDPRGFTIDRIDNDGNYEPGNIQFLTLEDNSRKEGGRL